VYVQRHTDRNCPRLAGWASTGPEIARITGHSHSMISRHLGVLRNGGVVIAHRHAQDVVYQIANLKIVSICDLMRDVLVEEASRRSKLVDGFQDDKDQTG
jgi:hypothetical protein